MLPGLRWLLPESMTVAVIDLGIIYLAGCHALFPAPLSASSFPCHGRTHDFESLEPAACNAEKR